jgi:hypothetical protein
MSSLLLGTLYFLSFAADLVIYDDPVLFSILDFKF